MDIIGLNCTRKLGKKRKPKKWINGILKKREEKNSKDEGEIMLTGKI